MCCTLKDGFNFNRKYHLPTEKGQRMFFTLSVLDFDPHGKIWEAIQTDFTLYIRNTGGVSALGSGIL